MADHADSERVRRLARLERLRQARAGWMSERRAAEQDSCDGSGSADEAGAEAAASSAARLDQLSERIAQRFEAEYRARGPAAPARNVRDARAPAPAASAPAAGARPLDELLRDVEQKCGICLEGFATDTPDRKPILLSPCGHSFCLACIKSYLRSAVRETCPLCRCTIASQAPNVTLCQMIDSLSVLRKAAVPAAAGAAATPSACNAIAKDDDDDNDDNDERSAPAGLRSALIDPTALGAATRYWREIARKSLRLRVLQAERDAEHQRVAGLVASVRSGEACLGALGERLEQVEASLAALTAERALLAAQMDEQTRKVHALQDGASEARARCELLDELVPGLARDVRKATLLLSALAPGFAPAP